MAHNGRPFAALSRSYATKARGITWDPRAARFVAAAQSIASLPRETSLPEIVVTGRANVGKSSLLQALVGSTSLFRTSKRAGCTTTLNFFHVGQAPYGLTLVDAPGYGARGRPEWGELFDHYVRTRTTLKRMYILINALHGLSDSDRAMLTHLDALVRDSQSQSSSPSHSRSSSHSSLHTSSEDDDPTPSIPRPPLTFQAIITKLDLAAREADSSSTSPSSSTRTPSNSTSTPSSTSSKLKTTIDDIFTLAPTCLPPILTSVVTGAGGGGRGFGLDKVRRSVEEACAIGTVRVAMAPKVVRR